jgi:hypothetical protein
MHQPLHHNYKKGISCYSRILEGMGNVVDSSACTDVGNMRCQDAEFLHLRDFLDIDRHTSRSRVGANNRLVASYSLSKAAA